jgi:hypothetical protein
MPLFPGRAIECLGLYAKTSEDSAAACIVSRTHLAESLRTDRGPVLPPLARRASAPLVRGSARRISTSCLLAALDFWITASIAGPRDLSTG